MLKAIDKVNASIQDRDGTSPVHPRLHFERARRPLDAGGVLHQRTAGPCEEVANGIHDTTFQSEVSKSFRLKPSGIHNTTFQSEVSKSFKLQRCIRDTTFHGAESFDPALAQRVAACSGRLADRATLADPASGVGANSKRHASTGNQLGDGAHGMGSMAVDPGTHQGRMEAIRKLLHVDSF